MGDSTWVHITVAEADEAEAKEIIGNVHIDEDANGVTFQIEEGNWGGTQDREDLRKAGIPYVGLHGDGGNYGEMSFAFAGEGEEHEESTCEGEPFVLVGEDMKIDAERLVQIKAFHEAHAKALEAISARDDDEN
jgi:hypothetical protein